MRFHINFDTGLAPTRKRPKPVSLTERLAGLQRALIAAQEAGDQEHADHLIEDIKTASEALEWDRRIVRERSVGLNRDAPLSDADSSVLNRFLFN